MELPALLANKAFVSGLEACLRSFLMFCLTTNSSTGIPSRSIKLLIPTIMYKEYNLL